MHKIPQIVLILILLLTVGLTQQLTAAPVVQSGDSPLATPWRTLVVTYEP